MGDDYQLYFLEDQQNKPVAVVLRKDATQELTPALPEVTTQLKPNCFPVPRSVWLTPPLVQT